MLKKITLSTLIILSFCFSKECFSEVTLIHNINGKSINNDELVSFEAIAFENGKVITIGDSNALINEFPEATQFDGQGQFLLPGFHDSHAHILSLAKTNRELSLQNITSLESTLKAIESYSKSPKHKWVISSNWNPQSWENQQLPSKEDLDKLHTKKPIWIKSIDGRVGWANSSALILANKHIKNKKIKINEELKTSLETGIFHYGSRSIIDQLTVSKSFFSSKIELRNALRQMSRSGVTSVNDLRIDWKTYHTYKRLRLENDLPIRVNGVLFSGAKKYQEMLELGIIEDDIDFLEINTISYVLDGALLTSDAALNSPYLDNSNSSGSLLQSQEFISSEINNNLPKGWNASIDATGDKAVQIALDLFSNPNLKKEGFRPRIEHSKIVNLNDIAKFKDHQIISSITPISTTEEMSLAQDKIGRERLRGGYAWQTLNKNGHKLVAGSDTPMYSLNPFDGIHAAVTRQNHNNKPSKGWIPIERLTVQQALAAYTINGAYANNQQDTLGSLEPGKWADFIIVNQDIFSIDPKEIWKTNVNQTWLAGRLIHPKQNIMPQTINNSSKKPENIFKSSLEKN